MPSIRAISGAAAVAALALSAVPAPANAGLGGCVQTAVSQTQVGGSFTLIPPSVSPVISLPDAGFQVNCVLDTVGWCTFHYDPVGPYSTGLEPETVDYVNCLTS